MLELCDSLYLKGGKLTTHIPDLDEFSDLDIITSDQGYKEALEMSINLGYKICLLPYTDNQFLAIDLSNKKPVLHIHNGIRFSSSTGVEYEYIAQFHQNFPQDYSGTLLYLYTVFRFKPGLLEVAYRERERVVLDSYSIKFLDISQTLYKFKLYRLYLRLRAIPMNVSNFFSAIGYKRRCFGFYGADGCGKSTTIDHLVRTFDRSSYFYLGVRGTYVSRTFRFIKSIVRRPSKMATDKCLRQESQVNGGLLRSVLYGFILSELFVRGVGISLYSFLLNRIVFVDRGPLDIVPQLSSNHLRSVCSWVNGIIFDRCFLLRADPNLLSIRSLEYDKTTSKKIQDNFILLNGSHFNAENAVVDTSYKDIDSVVKCISEVIVCKR